MWVFSLTCDTKVYGVAIAETLTWGGGQHYLTFCTHLARILQNVVLVASFYNKSQHEDDEKEGNGIVYIHIMFTILSSIFDVQSTVNKFNVSSTHFCSICKIEVRLAFRGEANWTTYTFSSAHHKKEGIVSSIKPLTSFVGSVKKIYIFGRRGVPL